VEGDVEGWLVRGCCRACGAGWVFFAGVVWWVRRVVCTDEELLVRGDRGW
jgi:hypothetical protein